MQTTRSKKERSHAVRDASVVVDNDVAAPPRQSLAASWIRTR